MGRETIISMNYEFNLLGLSTQLSGWKHESFPKIQDAPVRVALIRQIEEDMKEEEKSWWRKASTAVWNTVKKAAIPVAIGALAVGAVAMVVATGGTGAVLLAGAAAAGQAFATGMMVTAVGATAAVAGTAIKETVTRKNYPQDVYNEMADTGAAVFGVAYGAYNFSKLLSKFHFNPLLEFVGIPGGVGGGIGQAVDLKGVIAAIQSGVLSGAIALSAGLGDGAGKYQGPDLEIKDKQFGKKVGKHAEDFGLDAGNPDSRNWVRNKINDIFENPTQVREGEWRGLGPIQESGNNAPGTARFYIQGNDVVVTDLDGNFVTILKDGISNGRIVTAEIIWTQ